MGLGDPDKYMEEDEKFAQKLWEEEVKRPELKVIVKKKKKGKEKTTFRKRFLLLFSYGLSLNGRYITCYMLSCYIGRPTKG